MAHNVSQAQKTIIQFDEETSVASLTEVSLVIYTNNLDRDIFVDAFKASGQGEAIFRILYKSTTIHKERTSGSGINMNFELPNGLLLKKGETVEIKVTNCHDAVADFHGTIIMHRVT